jgi:hypothetical protein
MAIVEKINVEKEIKKETQKMETAVKGRKSFFGVVPVVFKIAVSKTKVHVGWNFAKPGTVVGDKQKYDDGTSQSSMATIVAVHNI